LGTDDKSHQVEVEKIESIVEMENAKRRNSV